MWLSGDLVKDFLNYFYYYRLIFYYYVLLQITLPPQLGIFLEVFWQNTFWKTFEGSLLLVNCKRLRHRCFPVSLQTAFSPVNNTCKSSLHYRENCSTVPNNFTNWQENTRDRVLCIDFAGKKTRNFTLKDFIRYVFS